jgi:hypothetical protein
MQIVLKDPREAIHLTTIFAPATEAADLKRRGGAPWANGIAVIVDGDDQIRIAKHLKLI